MEKRSPESSNSSLHKNGHNVSIQHQLQTRAGPKRKGLTPCSSDFSTSPSSGATHGLPLLWDAAEGEAAFSVFSGQHSLPCNLPSDELSLSGAIKAPLAHADFVFILILMLQWNGMKKHFFMGKKTFWFGAKSAVTNVSIGKTCFLSVWFVWLFVFLVPCIAKSLKL